MDHDARPARRPKLISFDVFGTLISVRASSYSAFEGNLRTPARTLITYRKRRMISASAAVQGAHRDPSIRFLLTVCFQK